MPEQQSPGPRSTGARHAVARAGHVIICSSSERPSPQLVVKAGHRQCSAVASEPSVRHRGRKVRRGTNILAAPLAKDYRWRCASASQMLCPTQCGRLHECTRSPVGPQDAERWQRGRIATTGENLVAPTVPSHVQCACGDYKEPCNLYCSSYGAGT